MASVAVDISFDHCGSTDGMEAKAIAVREGTLNYGKNADRPRAPLDEDELKPNHNDDYDLGVNETVERLIDTSKVIELEVIDPSIASDKVGYHFIKRAFDIVSCSAALVICAIPMAIIALLVKIDSPGPVFYKQERVGLNGKPVVVVKFRSMRVDAEKDGAQWAKDGDSRITKIGGFLRRTRLDEIPQFAAVVKGDLSLVGPRPEREVFCREFERYIHGFSQRTMVKPGITGLAQVNGGYDLLPAEKVLYDLDYIKHRGTLLDLRIILKTVGVLFSHEGAR